MTIHYQNGEENEVFIRGVIHLQNADNGVFRALMPSGRELTLLVDRIEGIYYKDGDEGEQK